MTYIERETVLALAKHYAIDEFYSVLEELPVFNDDANRLQGTWTNVSPWQLFEPSKDAYDNYVINKVRFHTAQCSNCHCNITIDDYDSYCPRCGAKMNYEE